METKYSTKAEGGNRGVIERYDTGKDDISLRVAVPTPPPRFFSGGGYGYT